MLWTVFLIGIFLIGVTGALKIVLASPASLKRAEFIRTYEFPMGLYEKLREKHPTFTRKEWALVASALRQFFIAHAMSGRKFVAMPSQVVDELWHEFILFTREYSKFCSQAFGQFLHHSPAATLAQGQPVMNAGLRRVWWYACKYENIDPRRPSRLPLLFAIDEKLSIPNGFRYRPDCRQVANAASSGIYCGSDFANSSYDGSTTGLGDDRSGGGSGDSGAGGGDGGSSGCGGGGCGGGGK